MDAGAGGAAAGALADLRARLNSVTISTLPLQTRPALELDGLEIVASHWLSWEQALARELPGHVRRYLGPGWRFRETRQLQGRGKVGVGQRVRARQVLLLKEHQPDLCSWAPAAVLPVFVFGGAGCRYQASSTIEPLHIPGTLKWALTISKICSPSSCFSSR